MTEPHSKSQKRELLHWVIRVPKDQAAFLYFQLEANEGLCFYSTIEESTKELYRDIALYSPKELEAEMRHFLASITPEVNPLVLKEETIIDS